MRNDTIVLIILLNKYIINIIYRYSKVKPSHECRLLISTVCWTSAILVLL